MNKVWKIVIASALSISAFQVAGDSAPRDVGAVGFDPAESVNRQIMTISALRFTSNFNHTNSTEIEAEGPQISVDLSESLNESVADFYVESAKLETSTQLALDHIRNRYTAGNLPRKLSTDYLASLPQPAGDEEFRCLAEAIYFEARGETLQGQRAVAEVILNRVKSKRYPNTICKVVNQGTGKKHQCQFSYTCDGIPNVVREKSAYTRGAKIARLMMDGLYEDKKLTDGALFYHTTAVTPKWSYVKKRTTQLGVHLFYR